MSVIKCQDCMFCRQEPWGSSECAITQNYVFRQHRCQLIDSTGEIYYIRENEYLAQCEDGQGIFVPNNYLDLLFNSYFLVDEAVEYDTDTITGRSMSYEIEEIPINEDNIIPTSVINFNGEGIAYSPHTSISIGHSSNCRSPTVTYSSTTGIRMRGR